MSHRPRPRPLTRRSRADVTPTPSRPPADVRAPAGRTRTTPPTCRVRRRSVRGVQLSFFGAGRAAGRAWPTSRGCWPARARWCGRARRRGCRWCSTTPADDPGWRAPALLDAYDECGVGGELTQTVDGLAAVRTQLPPGAAAAGRVAWATRRQQGAAEGLRARPAAASAVGASPQVTRSEHGYVLHLGESDEQSWSAVGAALAAAGSRARCWVRAAADRRTGSPGRSGCGGSRRWSASRRTGATERDWPSG